MGKKIFPFFILIWLLAGCAENDNFVVRGNLTNADNQTIYFEKNGLLKDSVIDSVKIKTDGTFTFRVPRATFPDLYRLRVGNQSVVLGIDTTETIVISGDANRMLGAKIEGSKQSVDIQRLRQSLHALQEDFTKFSENKNIEQKAVLQDSLIQHLQRHKEMVRSIILTNQLSLAAYYGLFQQLNNEYIFSPYRKDDIAYYQAVATGFHTFMPENERSKNLYQLVMGALAEGRKARQISAMNLQNKVAETGYIDLTLKDSNGYPKKLSELTGKVILVDFFTFETENITSYIFELRDIHQHYASKGFEIYQVGVGRSERVWRESVSNLPWMCVWDKSGVATATYNVQHLPTQFVINSQGEIVGRFTSVKDAEKLISTLL